MVVGLLFWTALGHKSTWWNLANAVLVVSFFGALYEIEEYLEDFFTASMRLGDGPDTANDIMLNVIGAAVAVVIIYAVTKYVPAKQVSNR